MRRTGTTERTWTSSGTAVDGLDMARAYNPLPSGRPCDTCPIRRATSVPERTPPGGREGLADTHGTCAAVVTWTPAGGRAAQANLVRNSSAERVDRLARKVTVTDRPSCTSAGSQSLRPVPAACPKRRGAARPG